VTADFEWKQYQKVVDETDIQKGVMYFKRTGSSVDVAADITAPDHKKLVFKNRELQVYFYKTHQLTRQDATKNKQTVESFLALGFGGRGHDLSRNFDVVYKGMEAVGGKPTYKLELTPKGAEARRMFPLITLWINPLTGISEEQKLDQGEGDYRLARYSNIVVNPPKLSDDAFSLPAK
jgi:hypothetical protein